AGSGAAGHDHVNGFGEAAQGDLLASIRGSEQTVESLADGATLLRGFAEPEAPALMAALLHLLAIAPFRHIITPGGHRMAGSITNCGRAGWVTDRGGYRYDPIDPLTRRPWPSLPAVFRRLAVRAASAGGFDGFDPDACLINRYEPGARLSLHQDRNERDFGQPIVSVSLGLPAIFLFGGSRRGDRPRRVRLESGDVAVWGGPARMFFHGVDPLDDG